MMRVVFQFCFYSTMILTSFSLIAEERKAFKITAGRDASCTYRSSSELNQSCHKALKRFAVEHCIENNQGTHIEEVEDTYTFDFVTGGECYNYPGSYYVATECSAYFLCSDGFK
jgi:hypothetical protein